MQFLCAESLRARRFQVRIGLHIRLQKQPRELSRTSKTASCTSHKDKLGTNVAQRMLASVLQAASPELLKTKASEALVHLVSSRPAIRLYFIITIRFFSARDEALVILRQKLKC